MKRMEKKGVCLAAPAVLGFLIFYVLPMGVTLWQSVSYGGIGGAASDPGDSSGAGPSACREISGKPVFPPDPALPYAGSCGGYCDGGADLSGNQGRAEYLSHTVGIFPAGLDLFLLGISDPGVALSVEEYRIRCDTAPGWSGHDPQGIYGNGQNGRGGKMEMPVLYTAAPSGAYDPVYSPDFSAECF